MQMKVFLKDILQEKFNKEYAFCDKNYSNLTCNLKSSHDRK